MGWAVSGISGMAMHAATVRMLTAMRNQRRVVMAGPVFNPDDGTQATVPAARQQYHRGRRSGIQAQDEPRQSYAVASTSSLAFARAVRLSTVPSASSSNSVRCASSLKACSATAT